MGGEFIFENHVTTTSHTAALLIYDPENLTINGGVFRHSGVLTHAILSTFDNLSQFIKTEVYHDSNYTPITDLEVKELTGNVKVGALGGLTEADPIIVSSFAQLKYALEHTALQYIKVTGTNASVVPISGTPDAALIYLPKKNLHKFLELAGSLTIGTEGESSVESLIYLRPKSLLTISGTGSLEFRTREHNAHNAVIWNTGHLQIKGGEIRGSYVNDVGKYGVAIYNEGASLSIAGGSLIGKSQDTQTGHAAVHLVSGRVGISGGEFIMYAPNGGSHTAMRVDAEADLRLAGGEFWVTKSGVSGLRGSIAIMAERAGALSSDFWDLVSPGYIAADKDNRPLYENSPDLSFMRIITEPVTTLRQRWLRDDSAPEFLPEPRYRLNGQKVH